MNFELTPYILNTLYKHAYKYMINLDCGMLYYDVNDFVNEAVEKMLIAYKRYNPNKGSFQSFMLHRGKGAMIDFLRYSSGMGNDRNLSFNIKSKLSSFDSIIELDDENNTPNDIRKCLAYNDKSFDEVDNRLFLDQIWNIIYNMDLKHRQVMILYYKLGFNQIDISDLCGVSKSRISQIISGIFRRLRLKLHILENWHETSKLVYNKKSRKELVKERNLNIVIQRQKGFTLKKIGEIHGLTRQGISKILIKLSQNKI